MISYGLSCSSPLTNRLSEFLCGPHLSSDKPRAAYSPSYQLTPSPFVSRRGQTGLRDPDDTVRPADVDKRARCTRNNRRALFKPHNTELGDFIPRHHFPHTTQENPGSQIRSRASTPTFHVRSGTAAAAQSPPEGADRSFLLARVDPFVSQSKERNCTHTAPSTRGAVFLFLSYIFQGGSPVAYRAARPPQLGKVYAGTLSSHKGMHFARV